MSTTGLVGILLGVCLGGSVLLLIAAWLGWKPSLSPRRSREARWDAATRKRALTAAGVAAVILLLTRWPVAAGAAAAVIWLWPSMFGGGKAALGQVERVAGDVDRVPARLDRRVCRA